MIKTIADCYLAAAQAETRKLEELAKLALAVRHSEIEQTIKLMKVRVQAIVKSARAYQEAFNAV